MKKLFLMMAVMAMISISACGQKSKDVPQKVKAAFSEKFPDASKIKWDKENATEWEAEFKMNGKAYSANFSADGKWMETEYEIEMEDVPATIKATLESKFANAKVGEPEVAESPEGKFYEFEVKSDGEEKDVVIDATGKVVKMEGEEDDNDKD